MPKLIKAVNIQRPSAYLLLSEGIGIYTTFKYNELTSEVTPSPAGEGWDEGDKCRGV